MTTANADTTSTPPTADMIMTDVLVKRGTGYTEFGVIYCDGCVCGIVLLFVLFVVLFVLLLFV